MQPDNDYGQADQVRLHVSSGVVWCGAGGHPGGSSGLPTSAFLDSAAFSGGGGVPPSSFRLVGNRDNADMIVRLYERSVVRGMNYRIELASPSLVGRAGPAAALRMLWSPAASAVASGGIHVMTSADFPSYLMLAAGASGDAEVAGRACLALSHHPAWPALSFLPRCSESHAVGLISDVVDPRWFRHPFRPHRISRLLAHLGVTPQNAAASLGLGRPGRNYDRFANALAVWYFDGIDSEPSAVNNFLARVLGSRSDRSAGILSACRRFVRFMHEVWVGELSRSAESGFSPGEFFKSAAEEDAYEEHRAAGGRQHGGDC